MSAELVRTFERIADLLEIDGADRFRVNSYRKVARTLKDFTGDVAALAAEGKLTDLDGVGKGTAERIQQFLDSGTIDVLTELESKLPKGLPDLLEIQGLGPKTVQTLHQELGVAGMDDLKAALDAGKLEGLPGIGKKKSQQIAEGVAFLEKSGGRTPIGIALPLAEDVLERVRGLDGVKQAEIAGSLRRGKETIGDIDILCCAADAKKTIEAFTGFDGVSRVLASGSTKGSVTIDTDGGRELQIDLRVVEKDSFGAALQYFTGSKEHNVRLRERAIKKGLRLNEYGLYDENKKQVAGKTEGSIYKKLGVTMVPPELREDRGEFDDPPSSDSLIELEDIRGDLHMHTNASDGKNSIEEMAEAAKERGYDYIAICDHSKSATIANGLSVDRMKKHIDDIREANERVKGITILVGTEVDILADGSLDYPDEILEQTDWVVASIHSAMTSAKSKGKKNPTQRTIAAMKNPFVSAIGHPTGRLIARREAFEIDMGKVIDAAIETKTMLEINAAWKRLDLKDIHARQAVDAGATIVINTDAHRTQHLDFMRYGIITARRGRVKKTDVANKLTLAALRKRVKEKRDA